MAQDFYEILGVDRTADQNTIKKAFRKMAMQYHPDQNPGDKEAEEKFREAAEAYEVLGDTEKRSQYDHLGHAAYTRRGGMGGHNFHDINDIFGAFGDIFGDFFGGGTRRSRTGPKRGSDLRYLLEIELKDVLMGLEKEITYETDENCNSCNGTGADPKHGMETCITCHGQGQVIQAQGFFQVSTTCPHCRGLGQTIKKPCSSCKGQGRQHVQRKLKVKVPPGVDTGTRLRVSGEGEGGYRGGPQGDLYVEIHVRENKGFQRAHKDLHREISISYLQAILGGEVEVETLTGLAILKVPNGTQPDDQLKLKGEGVPSLQSHGRGDLVFHIRVKIPKKLNKKEEAALRELAEEKGFNVLKSKGFFR